MNYIEQLAADVIAQAVKENSTDVHITPRKNDYIVNFRVLNKLLPHVKLKSSDSERLISHFKFNAEMDIGEHRRPQSGSYSCYVNNADYNLRLSTIPSLNRESLVIRILPQFNQIPFQQLSLFPKTSERLLNLLKQANGLIIFSGPTGSGKTSTVYSLINESLRTLNRNVITLEDPVEKKSYNFTQVQINEKAGLTFSAGLKAILRHDPDIIFVGEIRDAETAKIAVRAALTGHLVLSSMHARSAPGVIYRLLEFGVDLVDIEQTLISVSSQRLVKLGCQLCNRDVCQESCQSNLKGKQATVFELLGSKQIKAVLNDLKGIKSDITYEPLKKVIRKGIALGFINESEYERWVGDD